jgi:hypothetical protein
MQTRPDLALQMLADAIRHLTSPECLEASRAARIARADAQRAERARKAAARAQFGFDRVDLLDESPCDDDLLEVAQDCDANLVAMRVALVDAGIAQTDNNVARLRAFIAQR